MAPNIRNRSFSIAVEVTIDSEDAEGVLLAQGSRFGGHALYIKNRKLKYVYNFVGLVDQFVESTEEIPKGHVVLSASFEKDGDTMPTEGTLALHIRDKEVGSARIKTQPGKFSLAGEGLNVGREGAEPVTDDYPGNRPVGVHRRHDSQGDDRRQWQGVRGPRPGGEDGLCAGIESP